jgi:hypothetical protein
VAPRHQAEISADVAESPEAAGIINRRGESQIGELARPHVILPISLRY